MTPRNGLLPLVASLLCSVFAPAPGVAADMRTFEIGVFGGAYLGDSSAGVDNDLISGLRGGIPFTRHQALEPVFDRVKTTYQSIGREPEILSGDVPEEFTGIGANWVFNFPRPYSPFVPFFLLGLGQIQDEVTLLNGVTSRDDDIYFAWGGGFRAFVGDTFAVRGDIRWRSYRTFDVSSLSWDLTVGATWVFGRLR